MTFWFRCWKLEVNNMPMLLPTSHDDIFHARSPFFTNWVSLERSRWALWNVVILYNIWRLWFLVIIYPTMSLNTYHPFLCNFDFLTVVVYFGPNNPSAVTISFDITLSCPLTSIRPMEGKWGVLNFSPKAILWNF